MAIDADTERMMLNWARWRLGAPIGLAVSGAYELEARGRREEVPLPLLNGEASDVDQAVLKLDATLRQAIEEYWLRTGSVVEKARRCSCEASTLYRRLDRAHAAIKASRRQRQEKGERTRKALSHSHSQNRTPESE